MAGVTITQVPWTGIGVDPRGTATTAGGSVQASANPQLEGAVSSILGLKSSAATDAANAAGSTTSAAGYAAEGTAYGTAADIANQNALLSDISGNIKSLQEYRQLQVSVGEQTAQIASNGFGASGSNLDILRSSLQQGYISQQLVRTQQQLTKGGYLEEAAAARAEQAGTDITKNAALATAASYTAAGTLATANAANETAALNNFIGTSTLTSDQKLILAPLGADVTQPTTGVVTPTGTPPLPKITAPTGINYAGFGATGGTNVSVYGNKF